MFVVQDDPRGGLQQQTVLIGNLFEAPDKDAAGLIQHLRFAS